VFFDVAHSNQRQELQKEFDGGQFEFQNSANVNQVSQSGEREPQRGGPEQDPKAITLKGNHLPCDMEPYPIVKPRLSRKAPNRRAIPMKSRILVLQH
jgi:hypothetical protein